MRRVTENCFFPETEERSRKSKGIEREEKLGKLELGVGWARPTVTTTWEESDKVKTLPDLFLIFKFYKIIINRYYKC